MGWVDFNTWGMLSALIPFAMANVSAHGGAENLATAYEMGAVCLVLGDIASTMCHIPFSTALLLFTVFSCTTYICAAHKQSDNAAPVMILIFALGSFVLSVFNTLMLFSLCRKYSLISDVMVTQSRQSI